MKNGARFTIQGTRFKVQSSLNPKPGTLNPEHLIESRYILLNSQ
jgi:hypothetical protein